MNNSVLLGAYLGDIRIEFIKMMRTPAFAVPTVLFPLMFYVLFGLIIGGGRGNPEMELGALARFAAFGTMAPGLFGFGVSLAIEREKGLLTFRQALPAPPGAYLLARMTTAMAFVGISMILLLTLAFVAGKAPLSAGQAIHVFFVNVFGVLPFCAIGMYIGTVLSGQAAPGLINLVYLPMAFFSGLWIPLQFMGKTLQQLAPIWPAQHLSQLALNAVGVSSVGSTMTHVLALAGVTVLFFVLAMRRMGNFGFRLLGPRRATGGVAFSRAATATVVALAIGAVVAGVMGGNVPRSAQAAATSKDATEEGAGSAATDTSASAAPAGVAAPATAMISEFEGGSEGSSYGLGWRANDDKDRGGNSTIEQHLVEGGAQDSKGALEVSGEVGTAIQYPFVGTGFLPNGTKDLAWDKQGSMDYSKKTALIFDARGDGQMYTVVFIGPVMGGIPGMYGFTASQDWQEVRIPLKDVANTDLQRIKLISIGSMNPGPFRFQIDNVRVE